MRVTKSKTGGFVIEDEPIRVEGKAAKEILARMKMSDRGAVDVAHQTLLAECERIYKTTKRG